MPDARALNVSQTKPRVLRSKSMLMRNPPGAECVCVPESMTLSSVYR